MKIIQKHDLQYKQLKSERTGEVYSFSQVVSELLGSDQIFIACDKIPPNRKSSSPHRHTYVEEIIYVSKGNLTLRVGGNYQSVTEGSFIFFDPKDKELHYLVNETDIEAETITFSLKRDKDMVIYESDTVK